MDTGYISFGAVIAIIGKSGSYLFFGMVSIPFLVMSWNAEPKWLARFFWVTLSASLLCIFPFGFFDLVRKIPLFAGIQTPYRFLSWTMLSIAFQLVWVMTG